MTREVGGAELGTVLRTLSRFLREEGRVRAEIDSRKQATISGARLAVAAPWLVLLLLGSQSTTLAAYDTPAGLAILLPLGALLGTPVGGLPGPYLAGFFAFALVALLYLVTEELLVEARAVPERPWTTAMFFAGFLCMLVIEEIAA